MMDEQLQEFENTRKKEVREIINQCVKLLTQDIYELIQKEKFTMLKIEASIEDIKSIPRIYDEIERFKKRKEVSK